MSAEPCLSSRFRPGGEESYPAPDPLFYHAIALNEVRGFQYYRVGQAMHSKAPSADMALL